MIPITPLVLAFALATSAPLAIADQNQEHGDGNGAEIGHPGTADEHTRTVEITLYDIRFDPASIEVKAGETVRFVLINRGELLHEFSIGTLSMHENHEAKMQVLLENGYLTPTGINEEMAESEPRGETGDDEMKHDEPNSVLVGPGETQVLTWTFTGDAKLYYACNMPKHKDAGMLGTFQQP